MGQQDFIGDDSGVVFDVYDPLREVSISFHRAFWAHLSHRLAKQGDRIAAALLGLI